MGESNMTAPAVWVDSGVETSSTAATAICLGRLEAPLARCWEGRGGGGASRSKASTILTWLLPSTTATVFRVGGAAGAGTARCTVRRPSAVLRDSRCQRTPCRSKPADGIKPSGNCLFAFLVLFWG